MAQPRTTKQRLRAAISRAALRQKLALNAVLWSRRFRLGAHLRLVTNYLVEPQLRRLDGSEGAALEPHLRAAPRAVRRGAGAWPPS